MTEGAYEPPDLWIDITTLQKLLDTTRAQRPDDTLFLQACTDVLRDRCEQLERLWRERAAWNT